MVKPIILARYFPFTCALLPLLPNEVSFQLHAVIEQHRESHHLFVNYQLFLDLAPILFYLHPHYAPILLVVKQVTTQADLATVDLFV